MQIPYRLALKERIEQTGIVMTGKNSRTTRSIAPPSEHYAPGAQWDAAIPRITLVDALNQALHRYPNRPFINFMGKHITYREFGQMVDRTAAGLQQQGVGKCSRVGLYMPNTPFYPVMMFAALKLGATVVNFSPLYTADELRKQIADSGTEVMVALDLKQYGDAKNSAPDLIKDGSLKKLIVCPMADMLPTFKSILFRFFKRKDVFSPDRSSPAIRTFSDLGLYGIKPYPVNIHPNDIALLQYTGGTTGTPKGAMLSHFNIAANVKQIEEMFGARPDRDHDPALIQMGREKFLVSIPFFHIFGLTVGLINAMATGSELIILPNPRDMTATLEAIHKHRPTVFPAVPRMLQGIVAHKDLGHYNLKSIRAVISGGAALPTDVKAAFEQATGCGVYQGYGLSETSPVAASHPPCGEDHPASVGQPLPRTEIKIVDPENPDTALPVGTTGEICIRGPQVMRGYWNKPDETRKTMTRDGFFRTGDIGHIDDHGYVFITDRLKRMLAINGFKVYPNMVEQALYTHPSVAECVVIGVNKGTVKESVKAFIRYKDDATDKPTAEQWRIFLADKLHAMEIPRYFETRTEELPKTVVGKPDWKKLEDEEAQKVQAQPPSPPSPS